MAELRNIEPEGEKRILLFSQRNIATHWLSTCAIYEFEDIICDIDSVKMLSAGRAAWFNHGMRIANNKYLMRSGMVLNPGVSETKITGDYEMFFAYCQYPKELLYVDSVKGWKNHCKKSVCWLDEIWRFEVPIMKSFMSILKKFDHVIINCSESVDALNEAIGGAGKSIYLPPGVDGILFSPFPDPRPRPIDVYSIGRRGDVTHKALLRMAAERKIFYVYDTVNSSAQALDTKQHRSLVANHVKRARYFIVNPGKKNDPDPRIRQNEFGIRFFEGAAAGAVLIGETPENEEFKKIFNWPDAVVHLPFDSEGIGALINEMDAQPERQEEARRNNVMRSLLQHDWVYRWERILNMVGLKPMQQLLERKRRLRELSEVVVKEGRCIGQSDPGVS